MWHSFCHRGDIMTIKSILPSKFFSILDIDRRRNAIANIVTDASELNGLGFYPNHVFYINSFKDHFKLFEAIGTIHRVDVTLKANEIVLNEDSNNIDTYLSTSLNLLYEMYNTMAHINKTMPVKQTFTLLLKSWVSVSFFGPSISDTKS